MAGAVLMALYEPVVYIGGFQPHPDVLYLKAGRSGRISTRMKSYAGAIPGGMTFMYAASVTSNGEACSAERQLLAALAAIDGVEPVGGEWFRCIPFLKLTALDELVKVGKNMRQVRTTSPPPFGEKCKGKRGARRG